MTLLVHATGTLQANAPEGPFFLVLTANAGDEEKEKDGAPEGLAPLTGPRGLSKVAPWAAALSLGARVQGR